MKWLALVVVASLSFTSVASASLAPRKSSLAGRELTRALSTRALARVVKPLEEPKAEPEFNVTEQTEILLDGRPCSWKDVPPEASILKMEVTADKKTALKIYFRTRK
jgi:hypothetical protein